MLSKGRSASEFRNTLMMSACIGALVVAVPAAAQTGGPAAAVGAAATEQAHSGAGEGEITLIDPQPHTVGGPGTTLVTPVETPTIAVRDNIVPADRFDPTNITGIGQIITDSGGGFIGTCTGSLINPRMVLFAAHCVNTRPATAYGANSGGVAAGVGFETNTRANAAGQVDELVRWLLGSGPTADGRFQTNQAQSFYNLSQVFYDPRSLAPASCTTATSCFLEADIATGVLDTPARNIPTWALLFSPLDAPVTIDPANGTGYHVNIFGYGNTGNGTTGSVTTGGFRRRAAENMLGALVSFDQRNAFLFGTTGTFRPQPLYFLDFDDPNRGTATANPRDFNGFRDNALAREGTTGPGDSGGPLVLDRTFSRQVVIGVLSGGSTFFVGQPGGSYGTQSFYQPLFLYWDWIVANNPYRYVTATAGNRAWEDASGWVTELDPNYTIISGGQLVNGLPTNLGAGNTPGSIAGFGELCFQSPSSSPNPATNECEDIRTGAIRNGVPNLPGSAQAPVSGLGTEQVNPVNSIGMELVTAQGDGVGGGILTGGTETPQSTGFSTTVRPAPTLANGLPGATNFVPNNVDGVRTTGTVGRYYDVTLRNTGVVTLNTAVTIDRFTIRGATSQLNIASGASLTSLIDVQQMTGTISNNGTLITPGDYLLMSGLLTGNGTVRTPFLTSVLGTIAPGTVGTIGTLNIAGNLILSSGSSLLIDLGPGGTSDRIVVAANGTSTGSANLGGGVVFAPITGYRPANGDVFTFLTATGGVTGTFTAPASLSAILTPRVTVGANAVTVQVIAGSYASVATPGNPLQSAIGQILDQNRPNQGKYANLYGELDVLSLAAVRANLDALAPNHVPIQLDLGTAATEALNAFVRDRLGRVANGDLGGTVATYGQPLQLASLALAQDGSGDVRSDAGSPMQVNDASLNEDVSLFLAGGYLDGRGSALPFSSGGRSDFDGFYLTGGGEATFRPGTFVGFALGYSDLDGEARNAAASASGRVIQGTLYGAAAFGATGSLDLQVSVGEYRASTARTVPVGATVQTLVSRDDASTFLTELGFSSRMGSDAVSITPRVALRYSEIGYGPTAETGGTAALQYDLGNLTSWQARLGLTAAARRGAVRPYANVTFVNEFESRTAFFGGNLVGGIGNQALFLLPTTDQNWFEVGGGLTAGGERFSGSIAGETQLGRSDIRTYSVRGTLTWRF